MFTDVSGLIAENPPGLHYGVAAADLDGDGPVSFVVAGYGGPNRVLKWRRGVLIDVAPRSLADDGRQAIAVAAGDVDGDGREEVYVLNAETYAGPKPFADRLFDAGADGRWHDLFAGAGNEAVRNLTAGRSVAVVDRRGTGRYGFVVANFNSPSRLYELAPNGKLVDLAPSLGLNRTAAARGLWVGPLLSEFSAILFANENGPNFLFRNAGDGNFEEVAGACKLLDPEEHARGIAVLDADGDGRLDVACGNWEGRHRLFLRQVDGTFRDRATPALAMPSPVRTVIAADFDNDGFEELFFNNLGEPNRLFRANSAGCVMLDCGPLAEPDGVGTGAAFADVDGDGVLELLVSHGESAAQPLSLFKVTTDHGWLRVRPKTRFGAPARGAKVVLAAGGRRQIRIIDGGSGYLCQMEPVAHFGLGAETRIDSVTVTWPDGATAKVTAPPVRSVVDVPYPRG